MPAAPLNASAVLARAQTAGRGVLVVCAGLRGAYAEDDTLAAGLFVDRLVEAGYEPGAEAREALDRYRATDGDLGGAFRRTEHGARLVEIGFDSDIDLCATVDRYAVVGALTVEGGLPVIRPLAERSGN